MDLVPHYSDGESSGELVRHHAFLPADDLEAGCATGLKLACTEVIAWGGGAEFGVQMRGVSDNAVPHAVPKFVRRTVVDISTSAFAVGVVTEAGELFVAGLNDEGQLLPDNPDATVSDTSSVCLCGLASQTGSCWCIPHPIYAHSGSSTSAPPLV